MADHGNNLCALNFLFFIFDKANFQYPDNAILNICILSDIFIKLKDKIYFNFYFLNFKLSDKFDQKPMNRQTIQRIHSNESLQQYNLNQVGLEEAEHNYFMKYATSGFSQVNNTQKVTKKIQNKLVTQQHGAFSKIKSTQNQVLKELKQEYEILRNLPIEDKIPIKSRTKQREPISDYSSSIDERSQISSSKQSRTKKVSRDAEILAIQKKQLQIVISNSLKKIEQLLQNEMQLKKTVHQLKLQIQGKGGVNSEYEMQIRNLKKTEKELRENIQNLKNQLQKKIINIRELAEKNAFLEGQKSRRDLQQKSFYDNQRQIEDLLRKQKDRSMNAQIQIKRVQMEFQIFQKDKTAQINRLNRQLDSKMQEPNRQTQNIRHLQEQIRLKDQKIQGLIQQIQNLRGQIAKPISPPQYIPQPQDSNKKILQELVKQMKSKSESDSSVNNEAILRTLIDKLGSRKDESLKNELSQLRSQVENIRKKSIVPQQMQQVNPAEQLQLRSRIRQLQRVIDEEKRQKRLLLEQIENLKSQRQEILKESESHKRKIREYKDAESRLLHEIQSLSNFKVELQQSKMENFEIKQKLENILGNNNPNVNLVNVESQQPDIRRYEEEIRLLRRKVDELTFALNKVNEEKIMSENMLRESQGNEILRLNQDIAKYRQLMKNQEEELSKVTQQLKNEIKTKNSMIQDFTKRFEDLDNRNKEAIESSRLNYESLLKAEVAKHYNELQAMNQKVIELTKTNETFACQSQHYVRIQKEANELRRLTRTQRRTNEAIDHLWQIKQAEYDNINAVLSGIRN